MSEMDKGAFVAGGYSVEPGDGGSFVVFKGRYVDRVSGGQYTAMRGFTDWQDLMAWLHEEHRVNGHKADRADNAGEAGKGKEGMSDAVVNSNNSVFDIADEELLRRAVTYARGHRKGVRWSAVGECFGLGSTYAAQLCRRFGLDPEEIVRRR